jgi:hypothetical protein
MPGYRFAEAICSSTFASRRIVPDRHPKLQDSGTEPPDRATGYVTVNVLKMHRF